MVFKLCFKYMKKLILLMVAAVMAANCEGQKLSDLPRMATADTGDNFAMVRIVGSTKTTATMNIQKLRAYVHSVTLGVAGGGTGVTNFPANNLMAGNGTSPVSFIAPGPAGYVIRSNGTGFQCTQLNYSDLTGTSDETHGGTGRTSYVVGDMLYASATNTLAKLGIGSIGQQLRVSSGGFPEWFTPTTSGVTSVTGGNDINVAGTTTPTITTTYNTGKSGGQTIKGGTAAGEQLKLQGSATANTGNTTTPVIQMDGNTLNGSSVAQTYFKIQPTVNATSTAGYTAVQVNAVETATGSGSKYLLDLQVSGVSKMAVSSQGVVTNSTWQGAAVSELYGGVNQTSYTTGDMLYAAATNTLSKRAIGSTGDVLTVSGGLPQWAAPAVTTSNTVTFTNKRWTPRPLTTTTVSATPSINTDNYDIVQITAQAVNITSMTTNLSGTPVNGDMIEFQLTAASGTITLTWGASFVSGDFTMPTSFTTTTKIVVFQYITTSSYGSNKWVCVRS